MALRFFAFTSLVGLLTLVGCSEQSPDNAAPADVGNVKDKVAEIVELRNRIRDGFASGDVDAAHEPLHDVGNRLKELSQLTADGDLPAADKEAIEGHINTLFAAFGEVDKTLHGQEGATYDEKSTTIDDTIEKLVQICNPGP